MKLNLNELDFLFTFWLTVNVADDCRRAAPANILLIACTLVINRHPLFLGDKTT